MVEFKPTDGDPESWFLLDVFQRLVEKITGRDGGPGRDMTDAVCVAALEDMENATARFVRICSLGAFPLPADFQQVWAATVTHFEDLVDAMVATADARRAAEPRDRRFVVGAQLDELIAEFAVTEASARRRRQDLIDALHREEDEFRARATVLRDELDPDS
jgi:hypothetical protein